MAHKVLDYFTGVRTRRRPIDAAIPPFASFIKKESAGGIVLMASAVLALVLANSTPVVARAFSEFWTGTPITLTVGAGEGAWVLPSGKHPGHLAWWVSDALMAAFFFVIGLELKREVLGGELRDPRKAALPLIAAVGGLAVPGLIYAAINLGGDGIRGWAVPAATDIAFALGVLAILGRRVPAGVRVFLVTLAIADDLGALVIIALFYTSAEYLSFGSLGLALAAMGVMGGMNLLGVRRWWLYGLVGLALWYFVLQSGVHATIAGVLGAIMIPARKWIDRDEFARQSRRLADAFERDSGERAGEPALASPVQQGVLGAMERLTEGAQTPLQRLERAMLPLAAFFVLPVFALANAGVSIGSVAGQSVARPEAWGIFLGLVIGKPVGILGFAFLAVRLGWSALPAGVTWRHLLGAALLGGIGFTMSLFIAQLAFAQGGDPERLEIAKFAVLSGSVLAALLGVGVLLSCRVPDSPGAGSDRAAL